MNIRRYVSLAAVVLILAGVITFTHVNAQTSIVVDTPSITGTGPRAAQISATALGINGAVLPASGQLNSNVINATGMTSLSIMSTCDQIYNLFVVQYDLDGVTPLSGGGWTIRANVPVPATNITFMGTDVDINSTSGTAATAMRLPMRAFKLIFSNTTAVQGTCTSRIIASY